MAAMAGPLTATVAARVPSGSTVRRDRTTRSYLTSSPAEAGRAVRVYAQPPVSHRTGLAGFAPWSQIHGVSGQSVTEAQPAGRPGPAKARVIHVPACRRGYHRFLAIERRVSRRNSRAVKARITWRNYQFTAASIDCRSNWR